MEQPRVITASYVHAWASKFGKMVTAKKRRRRRSKRLKRLGLSP